MARSVSSSAVSRFEWKVKRMLLEAGQESEKFGFHASLWTLSLIKGNLFRTDTDVIRVFLVEDYAEEPLRNFTSRVFIADKNGTPQFLTEQVCESAEGYNGACVWETDIKDLREKEHVLSVDGAVSFVCILMLEITSEEEEESSVQVSINPKAEDSMDTLVLDLRRLLEDSALSDVTLKCGDRSIPAHRSILSARSEVFAAMLRNDMAESRSGVIEVSDVDPPVLKQFLQFIYSCKLLDMSMDAATQLYDAADKYGVESLKKICSVFMMENLAEGNACRILLLSDAHGDCDLKDCVVSFIMKTKFYQEDDK